MLRFKIIGPHGGTHTLFMRANIKCVKHQA